MQNFWSGFESKEHKIVSSLSYTRLLPFALGWLWNPAAPAVLCPPSKGSWRVFVCPVTGRCRVFLGDELSWWVCSCSSALQPGELNLCFGAQTPHWEVSKQHSKYAGWHGITLGSKMFFWKRSFTSSWGVSVRQPPPRQPLLSKQVITYALGMSHSRQAWRECPFPSELRENLEHVSVPLDRCVQQEGVGEGQGLCEMLGVNGVFWLKLCLLQMVKW